MKKDFVINNRKKVFDKMVDNSMLVLFNGRAPYKRGDERYQFSPDRNFYYVTGLDRENEIIMFVKTETANSVTLYVERDNGYLAKWVGANITPEEAENESSISNISYTDKFLEDAAETVFKNNIAHVYVDLEDRDWNAAESEGLKFAYEFRKKYPAVELLDAYAFFADLRMIKEPYELDLMRKAVKITTDGLEAMMKNAKAGMHEYELEAYFDFTLTKNGVRDKAFKTIVAAGKNGTILHYSDNTGIASDGDLVLVDCGAQVDYYNGDITRTFPVNGKFTPLQKQIYDIVLTGQKKVIEAIKPGIRFSKLNEILKEYYFNELKKIGLVDNFEDVSKYYFHGVSHYLGAETHDIGRYGDRILEPGMVLTVEPGLYIEEYSIGIRIEDDALVTEDGCELLSEGFMKTSEEIEEFMGNGNGI
ncbi:MAG: aminopeptidase P family protein [Clostridiales bacterium]|nr:aminopeptidase P family protein [Clostridiales bacterium]